MKENFPDTDPEKEIFGAAFNSFEIEPSGKFWNSALNNIIDKERSINRRQVILWRSVAVFLGVILAFSILHQYISDSKIRNLENGLAELNILQSKQQRQNEVTSPQSQNSIHYPANNGMIKSSKISHSVGINKLIEETTAISTPGTTYKIMQKNTMSSFKPFILLSGNNGNNDQLNNTLANLNANDYKTSQLNSTVKNVVRDNRNLSDTVSALVINDTTPLNKMTNSESSIKVYSKRSLTDSTTIAPISKEPGHKIQLIHKLSISAYFAPAIADDYLNDGNAEMEIKGNPRNVSAMESDPFACSTGFRLGLDISPKFTVYTGAYYNLFTYNIKQIVVYASQQENGTIGYSVETSTGLVNCPYPVNTPRLGDSIKIRGSSARGYLCIPLQLAYDLYSKRKMKMFIIGGVSANLAVYQSTEMYWQNTMLQDGESNVQGMQGLNSIQLGYSFGVGINYSLGRGFSILAEPEIEGAITPINSNTPVITYPYFYSVIAGITYHL